MLTGNCRLSLSVVVVGSGMSGVGGLVVVHCLFRLSLSFSIAGAFALPNNYCPRYQHRIREVLR
jgi:hypothetical protein